MSEHGFLKPNPVLFDLERLRPRSQLGNNSISGLVRIIYMMMMMMLMKKMMMMIMMMMMMMVMQVTRWAWVRPVLSAASSAQDSSSTSGRKFVRIVGELSHKLSYKLSYKLSQLSYSGVAK